MLAAATLLLTGHARAQQPMGVGTATALGGVAVTEARRSDALLWNPALVGIYDGPLASYSVLAVDLDALPSRGWAEPVRALGIATVPAGWATRALPGGGAAGAGGRVQWLATQHRDFALSLSSHHALGGTVPDEIARALGGEQALSGPMAGDSTVRTTATVLSLGRGMHAGRLPLVGDLWVGAAAKGWWVHSYGRGAFRVAEPAEDAYRETVIRDVPGYGLDVGLLAQPAARLRVGISISNVFSGAFRPRTGPRVRLVSLVPGEDAEVAVTEIVGPPLGSDDDGTEDVGLGRALWQSLAYPAVLRAGGSVETDVGSFAAAARSTLRDGGLDGPWAESPYALAYVGPRTFPLRASYAWGTDGQTASAGVVLGPCERRWTSAVTRRSGPWGTVYGVSAAVTVGSAAGCDIFR